LLLCAAVSYSDVACQQKANISKRVIKTESTGGTTLGPAASAPLCAAQHLASRAQPALSSQACSFTRRYVLCRDFVSRLVGELLGWSSTAVKNISLFPAPASNNNSPLLSPCALQRRYTYMHLILLLVIGIPHWLHYAMGVKGGKLCFGTQPLWQQIHCSVSTHKLRFATYLFCYTQHTGSSNYSNAVNDTFPSKYQFLLLANKLCFLIELLLRLEERRLVQVKNLTCQS
jgi:hypothetical protein